MRRLGLNKVAAAVLLVIAATFGFGIYYYFLQPMRVTHIMIAGTILTVEIADTTSEQVKGLSARNSLPADHGMLFVFDHEDFWGFWMKDMRFPLDIIWFNETPDAIFIERDLQPCTSTSCPIYVPPGLVMYVLEVNAGFATARNISLGTGFYFLSY
jgi:uncharacterized membrane protein (UPF0127 family)